MAVTREQVVANVATIHAAIADAAARSGRDAAAVTVVAAAKTVEPAIVGWALEAGIGAVGHNYVQELRDARRAISGDVRWHYIGALRSGSAHVVADHADVVETVAGERAARRLAGRAARAGRTIDVLIEVDYTQERGGLPAGDAPAAAGAVEALDGLRLRGLMTVPPQTAEPEGARPWFARLRELRDQLRRTHPDLLDLSMGMSLDYAIAVEEGATMVRIGTALFGARPS
jgi:hypothetical protein